MNGWRKLSIARRFYFPLGIYLLSLAVRRCIKVIGVSPVRSNRARRDLNLNRSSTPPTQQADKMPNGPATPVTPESKGRSATGGLGAILATVPLQDLSGDKLILSAPRATHNSVQVPSLGGIPLLAKLGQGGMGAVYYGIHPRLQQEVAVKVLPFEMAERNPEVIQRFFREAQLAARVKSSHLVSVLDVNQESGLFYIVMEYVSGVSGHSYLRQVIEAGEMGLNEAEALDLCIAVCTGLAAAHAKGIVHRDVKPDNMMIPRDEQTAELDIHGAKLADLGLARSDALDRTAMTESGVSMGTAGYAAPEQINDAKKSGKPADVFSMGATLYALLIGHSPFASSVLFQMLKATIDDPHEPVRILRPEISVPTAELIDRCLAKNPVERYVDAAALLAALKVCRTALGEPTQAQAALERVSELLRAKEVGQPVRDSKQPITPLPANGPTAASNPAVAPKKPRMVLLAAVLLLSVSIGVAGWHYSPLFGTAEIRGSGANGEMAKSKDVEQKNVQDAAAETEKRQQQEAAANQERLKKEEADKIAALKKAESDKLSVEDAKNKKEAVRFGERDENRRALGNAIPVAVEAKRREDWKQVLALLEAKRALPDNADNPNNDLADALLTEARSELKKRGEAERKAREPADDYQAAMAEARRVMALFENDAATFQQAEMAVNAVLALKGDNIDAKAMLESLRVPKKISLDLGGGMNMDLVLVKAGTFEMGSPEEEKERGIDESQHEVTISKAFYMGKFPVTQEQYEAVMNTNPSYFVKEKGGPKNPVEQVSWSDAVEFCEKMDALVKAKLPSGMKLQLPTEAQWEYACRAGTKTRFFTGDDEVDLARAGWYTKNANSKTHPVGQKTPNAFGLYDMHGNVYQWCMDAYTKEYEKLTPKDPFNDGEKSASRVVRCGSWIDVPNFCRSAYRYGLTPDARDGGFGFRVVVSALPSKTPDHSTTTTLPRAPLEKNASLELGGGIKMDLVLIKAGTFEMGSPEVEKGRYDDEKQHTVTISNAFYIAKYPVTQEQYEAVLKMNLLNSLKGEGGPKHPMEKVSWNEAVEFCEKLDVEVKGRLPEGMKIQLPTEAQWEYACRAGTKTRFYTGDDEENLAGAGWYTKISDSKTHPVGQKTPNAFGLYDMHGNVFQWCQDAYISEYEKLAQRDPFSSEGGAKHIVRGGSWRSVPECCRSSYRDNYPSDYRYDFVGFRVVVSLPLLKAP